MFSGGTLTEGQQTTPLACPLALLSPDLARPCVIGYPMRPKAFSFAACFATFGSTPAESPNGQPGTKTSPRCIDFRMSGSYICARHHPVRPEKRGRKLLDKTADKIQRNLHMGRRWNFAGPSQPTPHLNMPSAADAIKAFKQRFEPERG
jgi:hypothetical protein